MDDTTLLTSSAYELAAAIRDGLVSSRQVVDIHIRQVERVNPRLNVMVATRFDEARAEADAADAVLATRTSSAPPLPPLHGVPCSIKETFRLGGMPNTAGLPARRGVVPPGDGSQDAVTVRRLREAGAIPLGVTNISELAMWMESDNKVYGRSRNPYDPSRIVGGSSGGEGAAVAAGFAPFGLGSDIGGSIRMPAYFNGVFGHKPSSCLVPNSGQFPGDPGILNRYQCTGPLTRRASDLMPLLRLLAGPVPGDTEDTLCVGGELGDPAEVELGALRVIVVPGDGRFSVNTELAGAARLAADSLADAGARVEVREIRGLRKSFDIWSSMLGAGRTESFRTLLANGGKFNDATEIGRLLTGRSDHTLPAVALALFERLPELTPRRRARFVAMGRELKEQVDEVLGDDGVILYPPYPDLAPRHGAPLRSPLRWVYTAIWNVLELPVTAVPLGLSAAGLPMGVQVAARHGLDHRTIAVANHLESMLGGWVPPWSARARAHRSGPLT